MIRLVAVEPAEFDQAHAGCSGARVGLRTGSPSMLLVRTAYLAKRVVVAMLAVIFAQRLALALEAHVRHAPAAAGLDLSIATSKICRVPGAG